MLDGKGGGNSEEGLFCRGIKPCDAHIIPFGAGLLDAGKYPDDCVSIRSLGDHSKQAMATLQITVSAFCYERSQLS